jgi:hypothetical protein
VKERARPALIPSIEMSTPVVLIPVSETLDIISFLDWAATSNAVGNTPLHLLHSHHPRFVPVECSDKAAIEKVKRSFSTCKQEKRPAVVAPNPHTWKM